MVSADAIRSLVEPALTAAGLEVWDVEAGRGLIRILVDKPGGVDLDSLAALTSRVVSPLLDERPDLTPSGRYQLELSSPGVERRLRTLDQYQRYVGSEVSVKTTVPVAGARRFQGILAGVDDRAVRVTPADGVTVEISHDQIERTRTVLVWGPSPRPSPSRRPARAKSAAETKDAG